MPETVDLSDLTNRHRRRLYYLIRALLPDRDDSVAAWQQALARAGQTRPRDSRANVTDWLDDIARDFAVERRKTHSQVPFSDDLFRQLADSAPRSVEIVERRHRALAEILNRLPQPEKQLLRQKYERGMSAAHIATMEGRPIAAVNRDLTILHGMLASTLQAGAPDGSPEPPGGAADIGRLTDQLLDDTISDDGRIVLETLLLADAAAQAHYHRHVGLRAELEWRFRGEPMPPNTQSVIRRPVTPREWLVTICFLLVCIAAVAFIVLLFTGQLRKWWS